MSNSTAANVLVIEDERDIADLMILHLKREGYNPELVENGEDALKKVLQKEYQLLIVDWMLPGMSGLELAKKLRSEGKIRASVPILMVTARAQSADIVVGLEVGADDYLTKPFDISIFSARVRALLRRSQLAKEETDGRLQAGPLIVDTEKHEVLCEGERTTLTPSEFKLLHALMRNRGRVLTRERLIDLVQGEGVNVIDRAIDTHVFGLRKKLGNCGALVETIRGVGYRVNTAM